MRSFVDLLIVIIRKEEENVYIIVKKWTFHNFPATKTKRIAHGTLIAKYNLTVIVF